VRLTKSRRWFTARDDQTGVAKIGRITTT